MPHYRTQLPEKLTVEQVRNAREQMKVGGHPTVTAQMYCRSVDVLMERIAELEGNPTASLAHPSGHVNPDAASDVKDGSIELVSQESNRRAKIEAVD